MSVYRRRSTVVIIFYFLLCRNKMSSSTLPLFPSQQETVPTEIVYNHASGHVTGRRSTGQIRAATGATYSDANRTIVFEMSPLSDLAIDLSTLYFSYYHSATGSGICMDEGAYSPIERLTIRTASGVTLCTINEYARLCAFLSEVSMDASLRDTAWHLGFGPESSRPQQGRQYFCHLKGLFDQTSKYLYPSMFGGLTVEIRLREGSQWHHSTSNTPVSEFAYTIRDCSLEFDTVELSADVVMALKKKAMGEGIKMLFPSYAHAGFTIGSETQTILSIGNRNRSQKMFIALFQDQSVNQSTSALPVEKTSVRSRADIKVYQLKNGSSYLPQEPVQTTERAFLELQKAFHHATRGTLKWAEYGTTKFAIVRDLQTVASELSGASDSSANATNLDLVLNREGIPVAHRVDTYVQHDVVVHVVGTTVTVYN